MSMWGSYSQTYVNPENLVQAEQEVDSFMQLYNKILDRCQVKCIPTNYHEPELNKGEMVCIDRCVAKYFAVQKLLSQKMEQNAGSPSATGSATPSTTESEFSNML
ncbi:Tim10/DDP family zinc finger-domain-containing protein [Radiomyces spectabilis]|uniref:Tim10/DDP family zinc finger-domain-containing protein n=1 Tax=Radiomyces spectabilis TaxID=64574 RepID=UPI002220888A|nr:Tim10/DDP family zinc finger-domain-containing protein [Radiomyces spectabilis]KAI8388750.1 Tim10/DDP family zinc finger-domain-containing protein [Radiomyces spectabilis]